MIDQKDKKYFADMQTAGGNFDDASFVVGVNEWVNAENVRIGTTDAGVTGTVESIGSTLQLNTQSNYVQIGWAEDVQNKRFCTFYCDTVGDEHQIQCYDSVDKTVYTVLFSSQVTEGLNFSPNSLIQARVVNGILYWTDNNVLQKRVNIDSGIKLNHPSYVTNQVAYTLPISQDVIVIIRRPPILPLTPTKTLVPGITVNNVKTFAGQFAARYIFREGEESVLSPISVLINYGRPTAVENSVLVTMPLDNYIEQDVLQVDFCVRFGNSGNFFIVNSWNKNIPSQAAAIAAHNAGTALSYLFLNDKTGIALSSAYSVKPYDSVPLLSETLETGLDRLFLGNNLTSYNTPEGVDMAIEPAPNNITGRRYFKFGCDYKVGIVYRDRYKRIIGNVVTNDNLRFTAPERTYALFSGYEYIDCTLTDETLIPLEAYSYEFVITKNLTTRFFMESKVVAGNMRYAVKNAETGLITYQLTFPIGCYAIAIDATLLNKEGKGYLYQPENNDIVKIHTSTGLNYNIPVIGQDGNYILVAPKNLGDWTSVNVIYEIFTPYKESNNEPFYTVGQCYKVTNPETAFRAYSSNGVIYGDIWGMLESDAGAEYKVQAMNPNNDYWKEWYSDWGEINLVLYSKQLRKNTAVQYSNVYIQGSQVNGLSTFDALDEKILPLSMGVLRKLQQTSKTQEQGNIMLAIGEGDTASLYLGEVQLVGAAQNAFIASSPNVIGTVNILKGNFGTINPESVVQYRGVVIWLDMINGRVIQYASNGLFPISDYKMTRFWKLFSQQFMSMTQAEIEALGGRPFVFSIIDPRHDELLISIPKLLDTPPKGYLPDYPSTIYPFDIWDGQGKTIVYSLILNRWLGANLFNPEGFSTLNNELYSYYQGELYLHNQTDSYCNFYGVQYTPKIMFVSNVIPQRPKVYNNISVESNIVPSFVYFYNDYPYQQASDLVDYQFKDLEGVFYTPIYRNKLVPTATGFNTDGLLTAEKMRNVAMFCMAEFSVTTTALELKFIELGFVISKGHTT